MSPDAGDLEGLWIVGPGRAGLAFAEQLSLHLPNLRIDLLGRSLHGPRHPLLSADLVHYGSLTTGVASVPSAILLTVPDSRVAEVANLLLRLELPAVPVLHTSGVLDAGALAPLAAAGHPTGSLHPLVALSGTGTSSERLIGAWYAVEGDAGAVAVAASILRALKGKALEVEPNGKPLYHAAAVFASNYVVVLIGIAIRLLESAGIERPIAIAAAVDLATGAAHNVAESDPAGALSGPVTRGDVETLKKHLAVLSPQWRSLYSGLAREALELARSRGLDPGSADRISRSLNGAP